MRFSTRLEPCRLRPNEPEAGVGPILIGVGVAPGGSWPKILSPACAETLSDFETLQTLVIFCGVGLLLSLLLAMNDWMACIE